MTTQITIDETNKYCTKDIAKWIRQQLKQEFPKCRFSVRKESSNYISVDLMSVNFKVMKNFNEISENTILRLMHGRNQEREDVINFIKYRLENTHHQINQYSVEDDWAITEKAKELFKRVVEIANTHNWDRSDSMTDYFDVNYYLSINIGKWNKAYVVQA